MKAGLHSVDLDVGTVFSQAWGDTLHKFPSIKAIHVVDSARRIGSGLSATSLSRFKNGGYDLSGMSLQFFLLGLKICQPDAFAYYIKRLQSLIEEKTIEGVVTVAVSSSLAIPRDKQIQIVFLLCDLIRERSLTVDEVSTSIGISASHLLSLIQGHEMSEEEFYKIKYFLVECVLIL